MLQQASSSLGLLNTHAAVDEAGTDLRGSFLGITKIEPQALSEEGITCKRLKHMFWRSFHGVRLV